MTDPIADFLTRLRNAGRAGLPEVEVSHSRIKESIARILKQEGYLENYSVDGDKLKRIKLTLRFSGKRSVIAGLKRVSSPGLRRYVQATEIPRVLGGMGTAILSTSRGLMSGRDARKLNVGGEVICYVW